MRKMLIMIFAEDQLPSQFLMCFLILNSITNDILKFCSSFHSPAVTIGGKYETPVIIKFYGVCESAIHVDMHPFYKTKSKMYIR